MTVYFQLEQLYREKQCGVMATVLSSDGQGPARKGDFLFWAHGKCVAGTVGGGANEHQVLRACAELETAQQTIETVSFLSGSLPSCGGKLCVQLDRVDFSREEDVCFWRQKLKPAQRNRLFLLGAGHVVQEVAWLADRNEFSLVIIDPRRELLREENFPKNSHLISADSTSFFQESNPQADDFIVIAGPDHVTDLTALTWAAQTSAHYIGVLGSNRKIDAFGRVLREKNLWKMLQGRLYAPIGIPIHSRKPAELAIAIVAQLIQIRAESKAAQIKQ